MEAGGVGSCMQTFVASRNNTILILLQFESYTENVISHSDWTQVGTHRHENCFYGRQLIFINVDVITVNTFVQLSAIINIEIGLINYKQISTKTNGHFFSFFL